MTIHCTNKLYVAETPLGCPCNAETECKTLHSNCSFTYGMKDNISGCPTSMSFIYSFQKAFNFKQHTKSIQCTHCLAS